MFKEDGWKLIQEISAAVFRVATLVREPSLKRELISAAVEIVSRVNPEELELPSLPSLERLERIIVLGKTVGEISQINSSVLEREIGALKQKIKETVKSPGSFILSGFGGREGREVGREVGKELTSIRSSAAADRSAVSGNSAIRQSGNAESGIIRQSGNPASGKTQETDQQINAANRQAEILAYIAGFPEGCRAKDIYVRFSGFSDRTLRNDIRQLSESGKLEKSGGPSGPQVHLRIHSGGGTSLVTSEDLKAF